MEGDPSVGIDALLAHREWVRSLARLLVADRAGAEDLEQQAWLEAMTRPPRHGGALRAWFGRVLRRRASDARRERWRRGRPEEEAARPEAGRATADVVAEAEAHRRVVDAVLALEEPYRETVLLRFFEDLPPREVAARQSVPVETVRTRTRRALERLRERLDEGSGGDRGAWVAAVIPLAGVRWGTGAVTGGAIMASKAAVGAVVAAAILGGVAGGISTGIVLGGGEGPDAAAARAEVLALRGRIERMEARPGGTDGRAGAVPDERLAAQDRRIAALEVEAARRSEGRLTVEVAGVADAARESAEALDRARKQKETADAAFRERREAEANEKETIEQLRRRFQDRSLGDEDRTVALTKLRMVKDGINRDVVLAACDYFRSCASPGFREVILRDLHKTRDPDLKQLFLEALRSDPTEWVRERAARDIDDYLDDPAVVQALELARDGDASAKVRGSAGKTLEDRAKR
jgi:RNA polymerase sigma-70 factor (ECF subfamily)